MKGWIFALKTLHAEQTADEYCQQTLECNGSNWETTKTTVKYLFALVSYELNLFCLEKFVCVNVHLIQGCENSLVES